MNLFNVHPPGPKPKTTLLFPPKLGVSNNALCASPKVTDKLNCLASEFTSLSEPIERVKRLLHYASLLAPLEEWERVEANRVGGCATEVWVVAEMDEKGRMRFRADSDSEISKGLCWCLVWIFDGAEPQEVLMVHRDHLPHINIINGLNHSRLNTWHNVFFTMQKATQQINHL
ncbi:hypothetical protein RJT34_10588 [Clitoria ternatea]|uniref:Fe-S metabolism associated domain-containing protein n=1 Tax=Clitoria ternatea TaxID=43366 RepID=A0AAN9K9H6_CLITE